MNAFFKQFETIIESERSSKGRPPLALVKEITTPVPAALGEHRADKALPPGRDTEQAAMMAEQVTEIEQTSAWPVFSKIEAPAKPRQEQPCYCCHEIDYWQAPETGKWVCRACHPPADESFVTDTMRKGGNEQ